MVTVKPPFSPNLPYTNATNLFLIWKPESFRMLGKQTETGPEAKGAGLCVLVDLCECLLQPIRDMSAEVSLVFFIMGFRFKSYFLCVFLQPQFQKSWDIG